MTTLRGKPWTYSALEAFETCPRQFHEVKVLRRFRDRPNPAGDWGDRVHKALEDFMETGAALPEGMQQWQVLATTLKNLPGRKLTEVKLAVDKCFSPTPWGDAWSRGKVDLVVLNGREAAGFDYKTGKPKPSEQLMLYAGYMFATWPELEKAQTGFVWLKNRRIEPATYYRKDVPRIWQEFAPRVHRMELAQEKDAWPPRPSGLCNGWCPVTDCEHYKSKS
ncbi:PD-(D/E)XK nuclease family protein [Paraburkholderia sp. BL10I2N1]|uniref:PD-(D/E)XK nuclease family protein n=1 Tax=Paraburkholderia sp. BL10I2N1 TaxID=1938796 RepID=UPI0010622DCF|nr:PD-(D/E)XK nuclease family protein [Paraburkholderia sp. BL10I2N1]TDN70476.1 PD-(D/E)XK nuclease superfamily protein [Paraburkholderia sp. BL10I2N1]